MRIWIIDDDEVLANCIELACNYEKDFIIQKFTNVIDATSALDQLPDLFFLDLILDGPNGISFLNELNSYSDTMKIPIVIMSSLNLKYQDFDDYNVIKVLDKTTMTPQDVRRIVKEIASNKKAARYA